MRRLTLSLALFAATIFGGLSLLAIKPAIADSGEEAIKARRDFMGKEIYDHWKALAAYSKKGIGTLQDVEAHANALTSLSAKIPEHFPKDTGRGNYPDKMTRALPKIWENWEDFRKSAERLGEGSQRLAQAAKAGDKDMVVELIGKSGSYGKTKIGCAECHEKYQGPKVK